VHHVSNKVQLQTWRNLRHQAPVQDAQPPIGSAQQVARVRVAVPVRGGEWVRERESGSRAKRKVRVLKEKQ